MNHIANKLAPVKKKMQQTEKWKTKVICKYNYSQQWYRTRQSTAQHSTALMTLRQSSVLSLGWDGD